MDKKYIKGLTRKEYIQNLIPNMGYCFATDKITLEGKKSP